MESFVLPSLNCCSFGLFLLYKWSAVAQQINNSNKAPDLVGKSKFHSTRVYWFSSSQCKIMHLKLFCRCAHMYTPLPFSPTLLLGTESVKGFSSSNCSHSRGSWGEQCHVWYRGVRTVHMVKHQDVILGPYFFLCDRFSVLYSPCAKIKKKKKRESQTYLLRHWHYIQHPLV